MKILFITNLLPYPLNNGGKIKTYNTLSILTKKHDIDLFCFHEEENEKESKEVLKQICREVITIKKPLTTSKNLSYMKKIAVKNLLSHIPLVAYKFYDKEMEKRLIWALENKKYDIIYIDHLQLGIYVNIFKKYKCKIILDQHNCESIIMKRQFEKEKSIFKKIYLRYEYERLKLFEKKIVNIVDSVIVLSDEDMTSIFDLGLKKGKEHFTKIPIPVEVDFKKDIEYKIEEKIKILFLGTMSWYPNSQGIEWFINNVIPEIESKNIKYHMYIVGKDPSEQLYENCKNNNNITITGFVDSVNEYIEKCDVMIVPLFIGSGMRVKILESMGKGIPVISTAIGAEGIDFTEGRDILIANDINEFIEKINIIKNRDVYTSIQKSAFELFDAKYSVQVIESKYNNIL